MGIGIGIGIGIGSLLSRDMKSYMNRFTPYIDSCFCALRANIFFRMTILLAHSKGLEKAFQMI